MQRKFARLGRALHSSNTTPHYTLIYNIFAHSDKAAGSFSSFISTDGLCWVVLPVNSSLLHRASTMDAAALQRDQLRTKVSQAIFTYNNNGCILKDCDIKIFFHADPCDTTFLCLYFGNDGLGRGIRAAC